jgi:hypothetical protein
MNEALANYGPVNGGPRLQRREALILYRHSAPPADNIYYLLFEDHFLVL